ncbi:hypothetical protein GCM10028777_08770 [Angustibacter speluncae]
MAATWHEVSDRLRTDSRRLGLESARLRRRVAAIDWTGGRADRFRAALDTQLDVVDRLSGELAALSTRVQAHASKGAKG